MTNPSETLIELLKQTEKWLLQEFADEQKLTEAFSTENREKAAALFASAQKDEETLTRVHAALLGATVNWKTRYKDSFEEAILGNKPEFLSQWKLVSDHLDQVEKTYLQALTVLQAMRNSTQETPDVPTALRQALSILNRWRDSAHSLAREIGALESFREHLLKKLGEHAKYEKDLSEFSVDYTNWIGRGQSATTYRATHIQTGQQFALKFYSHPISFTEEEVHGLLSKAIERLVRVAHFDHPNLISCKGFCLEKDKGAYRLVAILPFAEGTTLSEYLTRKNWAETDIRRFFDIVGPALQYMVDNGIVHSDLAPRNVIVAGTSGNENYFLIDFENVSLLSKEVSRTLGASFDPFYSPSEVQKAIGEFLNPTIPFYSLGKIGIRMAVESESAFEELHLKNDFFPILVAKALEKRCTREFIQTVCMATLPDIKDRFPTWKLMREALEKGVAGKSLVKRFGAALKHVLTTPINNPFTGAATILGGGRIIPKAPEYQIVAGETKRAPALSARTEIHEEEPASLPIPPPLMPMNVIGIRKIPGYFEIETEHEVYRLHAKRTDGGKRKYQNDWVTYFNSLGDETRLYTPAEILRIVVALRQRIDSPSDKTEKDTAIELKAELRDDFMNNWMMSGARIDYNKDKGDRVIQHYGQATQNIVHVKKFWGKDDWLSKLPDSEADMIAHSLFEADKEDVRNTFKWLTDKDSYVWRANSSNDSQRPVVLGLDVGSNRFYIDAGSDLIIGPARGVAVRKKN